MSRRKKWAWIIFSWFVWSFTCALGTISVVATHPHHTFGNWIGGAAVWLGCVAAFPLLVMTICIVNSIDDPMGGP